MPRRLHDKDGNPQPQAREDCLRGGMVAVLCVLFFGMGAWIGLTLGGA